MYMHPGTILRTCDSRECVINSSSFRQNETPDARLGMYSPNKTLVHCCCFHVSPLCWVSLGRPAFGTTLEVRVLVGLTPVAPEVSWVTFWMVNQVLGSGLGIG